MFRNKIAAAGVILVLVAALTGPDPTAAQSPAAGSGSAGGGPSVFFPVKVFEFQPVLDGAHVVNDFVMLNKGSEPLLISNVRTS